MYVWYSGGLDIRYVDLRERTRSGINVHWFHLARHSPMHFPGSCSLGPPAKHTEANGSYLYSRIIKHHKGRQDHLYLSSTNTTETRYMFNGQIKVVSSSRRRRGTQVTTVASRGPSGIWASTVATPTLQRTYPLPQRPDASPRSPTID